MTTAKLRKKFERDYSRCEDITAEWLFSWFYVHRFNMMDQDDKKYEKMISLVEKMQSLLANK